MRLVVINPRLNSVTAIRPLGFGPYRLVTNNLQHPKYVRTLANFENSSCGCQSKERILLPILAVPCFRRHFQSGSRRGVKLLAAWCLGSQSYSGMKT